MPRKRFTHKKAAEEQPVQAEYNADDCQAELMVDWGTYSVSSAYVIRRPRGPRPAINILWMDGMNQEIRTMATWDGDEFLHGTKLQERLDEDPSLGDKVIDMFKLALYEDEGTLAVRQRTEDILSELGGNKTFDLLLYEHIRAIINDSKKAILEESVERASFSKEEFQKIIDNMTVRISVPEMWTPDACRRMQAAAKRAGASLVVLASEAQSATAFLVDKIHEKVSNMRLKETLKRGHNFAVVDLGCGTGDVAMYELLDDLSVKCALKPLGHTKGDLCGSLQVDNLLWARLKEKKAKADPDWVKKCAEKLGLSQRELERRARQKIEESKKKLRPTARDDYSETQVIDGMGYAKEDIAFSAAEIRSALDIVTKRVIALIDGHVKDTPLAFIQLTGGFSANTYLFQRLQQEYEKGRGVMIIRPGNEGSGSVFPILVGGLHRFDNIVEQKLPSRYGYGLLQRVPFHKDLHKDSYTEKRMVDGSIKLIYKDWVDTSPYDESVRVIDDCLRIIVKPGTPLETGDVRKISMEYRPPKRNPHISDELVYMSGDRSFKDGQRTRKAGGKNEFFKHIYPWMTVTIPLDTAELDKHDFDSGTDENGDEYWILCAWAKVKWDGRCMSLSYDILEKCDEKKPWEKRKVVMTQEGEVYDARFSPFHESVGI